MLMYVNAMYSYLVKAFTVPAPCIHDVLHLVEEVWTVHCNPSDLIGLPQAVMCCGYSPMSKSCSYPYVRSEGCSMGLARMG